MAKYKITSKCVMVVLIYDGLTWAVRNACRELQNEKSCPQCDSNPVPSPYEANTFALLDAISIELLKVDLVLPDCAIKIYLYHMVDVIKMLS